MTVLEFAPLAKLPAGWQSAEVQKLLASCAISLKSGDASGWDVGKTEAGDPQLYLLGPAPDYECILCVTRLGRQYVLEDGEGNIMFENRNFSLVIQQIRAALSRRKIMIVARMAILWAACRQVLEERIEPMLTEPLELATHIAPQLAAFA